MKFLQEAYEIPQGNPLYMSKIYLYVKDSSNISRKLIIYVKETHQICQRNSSYMSRKLIIYVKETLHICQAKP